MRTEVGDGREYPRCPPLIINNMTPQCYRKMLAVKRAAVKDKKGVVQKVITTKDIEELWMKEKKSLQLASRISRLTKIFLQLIYLVTFICERSDPKH